LTPLKKFAQQETSPKGRASTRGIQQKEPEVQRSPPKVDRSPGEKFAQSPDTSNLENKVN